MTAARMTQPVTNRRVGSCAPICASPAPSTAMINTPKKCVDDGTAPARQTRAADDACGDGLQFGSGACVRIGGRQTGALQNSGAGREQSAQAEYGDLDRTRIDAGITRGLFVRAYRQGVTPPDHPRERELRDDNGANRAGERRRNAEKRN